ncbi:MAG: DUF4367 domain-containing protein [Clostridia bacterium]|nr:DUF4367 domain-containing protein [Clostridia bacterium]
MENNQSAMKTPMEKYEEAALELASYRLLQGEQQKLSDPALNLTAWASPDDETEFSQRINKLIDAEFRKEALTNVLKTKPLRLLKFAALLILLVNMAITIAVAASDTIRVRVLQFLMQNTPSYTQIKFVPTGIEIEIPVDWSEDYFPTYIPQGFYMKKVEPYKEAALVVYENDRNQRIEIEICGPGAVAQVDSENAEMFNISIQGHSATVMQKNGWTRIVWNVGDRYIMVRSNTDYENTISVAESISPIQK